MIEFAKTGEKQKCKKLFSECFNDGEKYTSLVFEHLYKPSTTVVGRVGGKIVSQLFLIPFKYKKNGKKYSCQYIYGACTLPEYRGRGLMRDLLDYTNNVLISCSRSFTFLVPATKELYDYYAKSDYKTVFYRGYKEYITSKKAKEVYFSKINIGEFIKLRDSLLENNYLLQSRDTLKFTYEENKFFDGEILKIKCGGETGIAVVECEQDEVIVKELVINGKHQSDVASRLGLRYNKKTVKVYTPPTENYKRVKFGMYRPVSGFDISPDEGAYINLMYD